MTDRRTDRQMDGRPGKNNMSPDPEGGRHNYLYNAFSKYYLLYMPFNMTMFIFTSPYCPIGVVNDIDIKDLNCSTRSSTL